MKLDFFAKGQDQVFVGSRSRTIGWKLTLRPIAESNNLDYPTLPQAKKHVPLFVHVCFEPKIGRK